MWWLQILSVGSLLSQFCEARECQIPPVTQHLSDPPYENYFYSDCNSAAQVVVTSPQPDSNLSLIGPRLLVAWPAGNSGIAAYFSPKDDKNGTLALALENPNSSDSPLSPIFTSETSGSTNSNPVVGVSGLLNFNKSSDLVVPLLGSIRTIRDFSEGPSILVPEIQNAIQYSRQGRITTLSRLWLDNVTTTGLNFEPMSNGAAPVTIHKLSNGNTTLSFKPGTYRFNATFNYPQLTQLRARQVLNPQSQKLIRSDPSRTTSLAFLSYTNKLLAGCWRFLTYFGRDSMISLLLMEPILSEGEGGAKEAVISAVLERLNGSVGTVGHEETIGDYATYLNMQDNKTSTAPIMNYVMIDSDYYLPIVMRNYFLNTATGRARRNAFFAQKATLNFGNLGTTYANLALFNAERIMRFAGPFAQKGGQVKANLRSLEPDQIVGEWRDSTYGIGGGRYPYDVNTGLVPAALRAIADLSAAGFFPNHPRWKTLANQYAQVWEDETLQFFTTTVPQDRARQLVKTYVARSNFGGPSQARQINGPISFDAISLDGNNGLKKVNVMHTDASFRIFLLNTTNDVQLTALLNRTARQILLPFPAGLSSGVGLIVANPAYGANPVYAQNFTRSDYHGTVVWGWPMAMMAAGLERQLGRCDDTHKPAFCSNRPVYSNVKNAYNHLWDIIEANTELLSNEVWSWTYQRGKGKDGYIYTPLSELSPTESDIRQLWSLTFLAVTRNESLR